MEVIDELGTNSPPLGEKRESVSVSAPSFRTVGLVFALVSGLSILAYARSVQLPFIADDYVQIQLAREYGPTSGWQALAADALYRCRATSLVLTYWTERAFGLSALAFNGSSLVLHILNSLLVFALGFWRPIGWRRSAVAACVFAVSQRHHEAVIWYSAIPELLVFCFSILSFLCWIRWSQSEKPLLAAYAGTLIFFLLALISKESAVAVVPLLALSVVCDERRSWKQLWPVLPLALIGTIYFALGFLARQTHLHYNDGTFSITTPFWAVMARSGFRLLGVWGNLSLAALWIWKARDCRPVIAIAGAWIAITLLPYSFLTYMPFVPSRHTYLASAGLAVIVATGLLALYERSVMVNRGWVAVLVVLVLVTHQCVYLWTKKHHQFSMRAQPTEQLVNIAYRSEGSIYVKCFPYDRSVGDLALEYRLGREPRPRLVIADRPDAVDLCNSVTGRGRH